MEVKAEIGKIGNRNIALISMEAKDAIIPADNQHTCLILDCSASMTSSIHKVREDSIKYVEEMDKDEFVSVLIFSGHGQSKVIAKPTRCTDIGRKAVTDAIKKNVRPLNTTVFSEPLEETLRMMKDFSVTNTLHNLVLFTDGCAVPTAWGVFEEQRKAYSLAKSLGEFKTLVNVIGYSVYYDEKFINTLMQYAEDNGIYRHISEIDSFYEAIEDIKSVFDNTESTNFVVNFSTERNRLERIFKLTPQIAIERNPVEVYNLQDGKITFCPF